MDYSFGVKPAAARHVGEEPSSKSASKSKQNYISGLNPSNVQIFPMSASVSIFAVPLLKRTSLKTSSREGKPFEWSLDMGAGVKDPAA